MRTLVIGLLAIPLALTAGVGATAAKPAKPAKGEAAESADPNAAVAKTHGGKVWVVSDRVPSVEGDRLSAWLASQTAAGTVERKAKDTPWTITYVAVFKKPAAKGPITVQFFEKEDRANVVDQYSADNDIATSVFQASYDLEPDHGFNAGRTYVIRVGQILKGKFQSYAEGQLTLK